MVDKRIGKYLRVNREVSAKTQIISEAPSIVGPKWNSDDEDPTAIAFSCVGCFEPIRNLQSKCPSCLWPACRADCSGLTNTMLHDIECGLLKIGRGPSNRNDIRAIKDYYRSDALLALKILILQKKSPDRFSAIMAMESNEKNRLLTYNFTEAEDRINYLLDNFLNPLKEAEAKSGQTILALKDKAMLHKIFGIIETNAIYIGLSTGTEICGLYPTVCLLEHSCLPNCSYNFDMKRGFKIALEAACDISVGQHLSTSYSNILWCTQLRQQHLTDAKYFTCMCQRCKDPTELGTNFSTLRCLGSDDAPCNGLQLPTEPIAATCEWACNKCPMKISNEHVSFLTGKMNEEIEATMASAPSPKVLEELAEKLSQFLHPTHYLMFTLKHALLQLYGTHKSSPIESLSDSILNKKLEMCNELLQVVQTLDPHSIRVPIYIGILFYEKHNALRELHKRQGNEALKEEAKKCLNEAQKILQKELDPFQGKQLNIKIANALLTF